MAKGHFVVPEFILSDQNLLLYLISMYICSEFKDEIIDKSISFEDKTYTTSKLSVYIHNSIFKSVSFVVKRGKEFQMPNIIFKDNECE